MSKLKQAPETTAVFFDVDDTLYDHLTPFYTAVREVAGTSDHFPYEEAYHRMRYYSDKLSHELGGAEAMEQSNATEHVRRERFKLSLAEHGIKLSDEEAARMQAAYLGCQYKIALFPGARELMTALRDRGVLLGLITNGAPEHQTNKLEALQLDDLIPAGHRFISGAAGWDKPDIRLFQHVNQATGTRPEDCVYIGDSWRNDVVGALGAGWQAIWFNHRGVTPESDHQPHHIVCSYEELSALLLPLLPLPQ
ncbi:HAD family hydrolase [Paenibacillus sp. SYP-B4298]|uniref:HAD family hydrolase n=1 Tax=Paenibacillus sp. SYP-B4298 TaxID=2996034 RepID=UPI0022DE3DA7|nr:HAD family hydrolase [Paenibacillus sp. SYP-B4298]